MDDTMDDVEPVVIAFPVDEADRKELELQFGRKVPRPHTSSVVGQCACCGHEVWVGPRSQGAATMASVWCIKCVNRQTATGDLEIVSLIGLGNPERVTDE